MSRPVGLLVFALTIVLASSHLAVAETESAALQMTAEAQMASLSWLAGHWQSEQAEAHYSAPEGNVILSWTKTDVRDGAIYPEFEIIRIEDGVVQYTPYPNAQRSHDSFPLKACDPVHRWVEFENLAHDWPTHFRFESPDPATLHIVVSGPSEESGEVSSLEFNFTRVDSE